MKRSETVDFWTKKTCVSYVLAIFVFFIHISSFGIYPENGTIVSAFCIGIGDYFHELAQFSVPLFFILSGALFFRNYDNSNYLSKLKKRARTLFVPYIAWNLVGLLFSIFATLFLAKYFIARQPMQIDIESILMGIFCYSQNGPFWFVADLIIFVVLSPLFYNALKYKRLGGGGMLVLIFLYMFDFLPNRLLFDSSACLFYATGAIIGIHFPNVLQKKWTGSQSMVAALLFFAMMTYLFLKREGYVNEPEVYGMGHLLTQIERLIAAISFWIFFDAIMPYIQPHRKFYKYSFWVFALHVNTGAIVAKLIYFALPKYPAFSILNFILTVITTLTIINLLARFCEKQIPRLYKVMSGGR